MSLPTTVEGVVARMREIDAELPAGDGVAVFNRMYLTVTERIGELLAGPGADPPLFGDPETMAELDIRFAHLWLTAYDAGVAEETSRAPGGRCSRRVPVTGCPCSTRSRG